MWDKRFEGWYFKHQNAGETAAFIPGKANSGAFVQVITNARSWQFPVSKFRVEQKIYADDCMFGSEGVTINLPEMRGKIAYGPLTELRSDIMGPFRFLPMECRHGVISMRHTLTGWLEIQGRKLDFTGGLGYVEKDSGRSFPKNYLWIQCNDFPVACSIMVSIAHIPFAGLWFRGCICAIVYEDREFRLATYSGVKTQAAGPKRICLLQGNKRLEVDILETKGSHPLKSPRNGGMTGIIKECNRATARFRFWEKGRLIFDFTSNNAGFEYFR